MATKKSEKKPDKKASKVAKVVKYPKALSTHRKTQTAEGWRREKKQELGGTKGPKKPASPKKAK